MSIRRHQILAALEAGPMTVHQLIEFFNYHGGQSGMSKTLREMARQGLVEKGPKVPRQRSDHLGPLLLETWQALATHDPSRLWPLRKIGSISEMQPGKGEVQKIVIAPATQPAPPIVPQALLARTPLEMAWRAYA